jgi:hypothetical protein
MAQLLDFETARHRRNCAAQAYDEVLIAHCVVGKLILREAPLEAIKAAVEGLCQALDRAQADRAGQTGA